MVVGGHSYNQDLSASQLRPNREPLSGGFSSIYHHRQLIESESGSIAFPGVLFSFYVRPLVSLGSPELIR